MAQKKYDWLRFWGPRDGKFMVNSYGALEDPRSEYGHIFNPQAKTLEELQGTHCLALLGEPGTGKSEELKQQVEKYVERHANDAVLTFQLRDYQTDGTLCADIFGNPAVSDWRNGDQNLYLYLDSLDEGLLTVNTLANILVRELKKLPADRLYLRIACRTAEWPVTVENGLLEHWGEEEFKICELLPLREIDIREAVPRITKQDKKRISQEFSSGIEAVASHIAKLEEINGDPARLPESYENLELLLREYLRRSNFRLRPNEDALECLVRQSDGLLRAPYPLKRLKQFRLVREGVQRLVRRAMAVPGGLKASGELIQAFGSKHFKEHMRFANTVDARLKSYANIDFRKVTGRNISRISDLYRDTAAAFENRLRLLVGLNCIAIGKGRT